MKVLKINKTPLPESPINSFKCYTISWIRFNLNMIVVNDCEKVSL